MLIYTGLHSGSIYEVKKKGLNCSIRRVAYRHFASVHSALLLIISSVGQVFLFPSATFFFFHFFFLFIIHDERSRDNLNLGTYSNLWFSDLGSVKISYSIFASLRAALRLIVFEWVCPIHSYIGNRLPCSRYPNQILSDGI